MGTWTTPAAVACDENEDRAVDVTDPYRYLFRTADREAATVPVRIELSMIDFVLIVALYLVVIDSKEDIAVEASIPIVPVVSWNILVPFFGRHL